MHHNPNLSPINDLAAIFCKIEDRVASLERASTSGSGAGYLPITGGTITGNLAITGTLNVTGTSTLGVVNATSVSGNGSGLTNLNAANLASGTIPAARIDGSTITNLNASNLASGTVPSARISGSYAGITAVGTLGSLTVSGAASIGTTLTLPGYISITGGADAAGNIRFSAANPYITASSYIIMPGGLYISGGTLYVQSLAYFRGGITNDQGAMNISSASGNHIILTAGSNLIYTANGQYRSDKVTGTDWTGKNILLYPNAGSGGPGSAGIAFNAYGFAVILRVHSTNGARMEVLNSNESAYAAIAASAFTVASSLRFKENVTEMGDGELLDKIGRVRSHRYTPKVRPQTTSELDDGMESHDHDCAVDDCPGTPDHPCSIAVNDTPRFGLIAEYVGDVMPEVVTFDADGVAETVDVDQVAALALGGVGALHRRVMELESLVQALGTGR